MSRLWRRYRWLGVAGVGLLLLAAFAWVLLDSQARSRHELEQRFVDRGALAARFASAYVADLATQERRQAALRLSGPAASRSDFEAVVANFNFQAAVLLAADGRVVQVWPRKPAAIGQPIAARYPHLKRAVTLGRVGVSSVVRALVGGAPIVAIAVPYATPQGRRVFSGGFDLGDTPLGSYLRNYTPIAGSAAYIVDAHGVPITASDPTAVLHPSAAQRQRFQSAPRLATGGHRIGADYVVVQSVAGSSWRIVLTVPTAGLYAPVAGPWANVGWLLLFLFAATAIALLILLHRLNHKNAMLAEAGSAQERLLEQERIQLERLREIDGLKDEFITLASHELRTPLTSIAGYLELLLEEEERLEPEHLTFLHTIRRNSDRVLRLVNDLLDLSRIDTSELSFDMQPLSISPIAQEAMLVHARDAALKEIILTSTITADRPIIGDAVRLRQALDNLLSNAIKYTPAGGRVTVAVADTPDNVVFTVCDTGIGIPEAERSQLFERFFRASTARDQHIQGTGLGLAITKAIVLAHAGSIAVAGSGPGTTVVVTLPHAG